MVKVLDDDWVKKAEEIGKDLVSIGFTTSQLRKFFAQVCSIQSQASLYKGNNLEYSSQGWSKLRTKILLLEPRLGYQIEKLSLKKDERDRLKGIFSNKDCFGLLLSHAKDSPEDFLTFSSFVEMVVAYHRIQGGREQ